MSDSYLKMMLGDHKVAAILPSSRHVVARVIRLLDLDNIQTLVELGAGDGTCTKPILARLRPNARLVAIERNPIFAQVVRDIADTRLQVVEGDANELPKILRETGTTQVDAVIASIPFTYLTPPQRQALIATAKSILKPGGRLIVFHQYTPLMYPVIKECFGNCHPELELRNFPPCFVLSAVA